MATNSFYHIETGLLTGQKYHGNDQGFVDRTCVDGIASIAGDFDHLSQRIDLATLEVIDYQPPRPSVNHEWSVDTKRWTLTPIASARQHDIANAKAAIAQLELSQQRPLREAMLNPNDGEARQRVANIDQQIVIQRAIIAINQSHG